MKLMTKAVELVPQQLQAGPTYGHVKTLLLKSSLQTWHSNGGTHKVQIFFVVR